MHNLGPTLTGVREQERAERRALVASRCAHFGARSAAASHGAFSSFASLGLIGTKQQLRQQAAAASCVHASGGSKNSE